MVHVAHCSKASGFRSACKCGLQLACATGKHVMERHGSLCTDERSHAPSLQPEGRTAGFPSGFVAGFSGESKEESQDTPGEWNRGDHRQLAMGQGREKRGYREILMFSLGKVFREHVRKYIEYSLYSLVIKWFVITTWFSLNSVEDLKVFRCLKGAFV